jgi:hypothetical protein
LRELKRRPTPLTPLLGKTEGIHHTHWGLNAYITH